MSKSEHMLVRIVYKKTDKWYIKWQRKVQRMTTSGKTTDDKWKQVSGTTSGNEWQRVIQQVVQRMTTSGATNESKWEWL